LDLKKIKKYEKNSKSSSGLIDKLST